MWLVDYASMEGNYFLCFPVFAIGSGCGGKEIILFSNQLKKILVYTNQLLLKLTSLCLGVDLLCFFL